jgi:hypothetical protein
VTPTEDERRSLTSPPDGSADAADDALGERDVLEDAPVVPAWELLPSPQPRPVGAEVYQRPTSNSPDDVVIRLVSGLWLPLAMVFTFFAAFALINTLFFSQVLDWISLVIFLPFVVIAAFGWYKVLSSPRLKVGSEGFALTTYGFSRASIDVPWADIVALRLYAQGLPRGGYVLHLLITPRPGGPLSSPHRNVLDIPLGMTGITKVDRALRRHRPPKYSVRGSDARFPW